MNTTDTEDRHMCSGECRHDCPSCRREEQRKLINRILLNMGKYDPESLQYEILRRELVRELDVLDEMA